MADNVIDADSSLTISDAESETQPCKRQTTMRHFLGKSMTMSPDTTHISSIINTPSRAVKKKSLIWKYFLKKGDMATCLSCNADVKCSGNTTNCKKHLERHHPTKLRALDDANLVSSTSGEEADTTKKRSGKQQSMRKFTKQQKAAYTSDSQRKKTLDKKLLGMVVRDLQPLSIVDDDGFIAFVQELDPRYAMPSRRHLRDVLLKKAYDETKSVLENVLKSVKYVAITFDGWTSKTMQHYLTVTVHFIEKNVLKAATLAVEPMDCRATGSNMSKIISNCFSPYPDVFVVAAVTDNAANVKLCCNELKMTNIPCASHTIQLVVNKAIYKSDVDEVDNDVNESSELTVANIIRKAKKLVTFFHHSSVGSMELEKELKRCGMANLTLKQSVVTRWNSSYYMLQTIYKAQEAIVVALLRIENNVVQLTAKERSYIPHILKILKPFVEATEKLGGENYATVSLVIPCVKHIMHQLANFRSEFLEYAELLNFILELESAAKEKLMPYEERRNIAGFATILDPRFKEHGFLHNHNYTRALYEMQKELKNEVNASHSQYGQRQRHEQSNTKAQPMFPFLKELPITSVSIPAYSQAIVHINNYLSANIVDSETDIIDYWQNYTCCAELKALALRYLIVPATSVPSERTNSTAGNIITEKRSRLAPLVAEQLIFLRKNFEYLKLN